MPDSVVVEFNFRHEGGGPEHVGPLFGYGHLAAGVIKAASVSRRKRDALAADGERAMLDHPTGGMRHGVTHRRISVGILHQLATVVAGDARRPARPFSRH